MVSANTELTNVTQISTGDYHTCALLEDTTVKCWGRDNYGQLGDGSNTDSSTPVDVMVSANTKLTDVTQISTSAGHTCALLEDATVKCWGRNNHGQLGDGTTTASSTPVDVLFNQRQCPDDTTSRPGSQACVSCAEEQENWARECVCMSVDCVARHAAFHVQCTTTCHV